MVIHRDEAILSEEASTEREETEKNERQKRRLCFQLAGLVMPGQDFPWLMIIYFKNLILPLHIYWPTTEQFINLALYKLICQLIAKTSAFLRLPARHLQRGLSNTR